MSWLLDPETWIALVTLTVLEIVLGVDNIVFISILAGKLPRQQQASARRAGLVAAMLTRIALLLSLAWLIRVTRPLFSLFGHAFSGRDLLFLAGGLFLLAKATTEIHDRLEGKEGHASARVPPSFVAVIVQIMLLDVVFSLDSVITAVGMAQQIWVMAAAIVIAVAIMLVASRPIVRFIHLHPSVKMLALSFVLLIGLALVADGMGFHIPKGYLYFAMLFSVFVEGLNITLARRRRRAESNRTIGLAGPRESEASVSR
jgi:predicted tellurium resistance membrane protein TerC